MSTTKRAATWLALTGLVGAAAVGSPVTAGAATTELPVYEVKSAGLSPEQAAALQKAFGLRGVERAEDGSVSFADEATYLRVPGLDHGTGEVDEDGLPTTRSQLDLEALKQVRAIPTDSAAKRAQEALRGIGLLPGNATAHAAHTTFEVVDANSRVVASAPLDTAVSFAFTLGGVPLEGAGAKIRVAYDGRGAVTGLTHSTREVAEAGTVPVLDLTEARGRCAKVLTGDVRLTDVSYVYEAPALAEKVARLEPGIRCSGVGPDGAAAQPVTVPAAVDAALPEPGPDQPPRAEAGGLAPQWTNRVDVGSEGTGPCAGLPWTATNVNGFNGQFTSRGIPVQFSWLNANAWERDFKDPAYAGGNDQVYADDVDMTYWQGRGAPTGFSFAGCSNNTDTFLANTEARWGNRDVEWMSLFTSSILQGSAGGQSWAQRWGRAFRGLHQINSFDTASVHSKAHGSRFGNYLLRKPFLWWNKPMKVRDAWAQASIDTQPSWVRWATMGPIGPSWTATYNDYFWGKGPVGPDILPTGGYWRLSGTS
ncbi:DUF6345 domain-containing protein [Saccharothrix algeriensis]|uniref:Uncharacterized protein n=1 Tax=Saccharothrix algeriensis TaxID=173560 RepID=A0A8T8I3B6_9PSEU|nr:DUF6345 domain-containing protein [Saccharothrix algeriensis]MBM7811317.1 hypothetical protein [Saccharothrix algeriensis]QTR05207.1 hypothetical protein J7S33_11255 [Saccharothrix algeriensis]